MSTIWVSRNLAFISCLVLSHHHLGIVSASRLSQVLFPDQSPFAFACTFPVFFLSSFLCVACVRCCLLLALQYGHRVELGRSAFLRKQVFVGSGHRKFERNTMWEQWRCRTWVAVHMVEVYALSVCVVVLCVSVWRAYLGFVWLLFGTENAGTRFWRTKSEMAGFI